MSLAKGCGAAIPSGLPSTMNHPNPKALAELLSEFAAMQDFDERAELLIEFSERFKEVPAVVAARPFSEQSRVPACESEAHAWAVPTPDGTLKFYFAVENPQGISAKALAVILDETLSGCAPGELAGVPEDLVYDIFGRGLSMGKGQGLMSMVGMVKALARRAAGSV